MNKTLLALFAVIALPALAIAGTGGAEFNAAYTLSLIHI